MRANSPAPDRSAAARPQPSQAWRPIPNKAATSTAYRRTRGGKPEVKRILLTAAVSARKHNPTLKALYERLVHNGKKPLVAITAIMRKLVVIANAKLKSNMSQQLS